MRLSQKDFASLDTFYTGRGIDQYLSKHYSSTQDLKSNFNSYYSRSSKTNYNSQLDQYLHQNRDHNTASKAFDYKIDHSYIQYKHNAQKDTKKLKNEQGVEYKCACESKSYKTLLKSYRKDRQKYQFKQEKKKDKVSTSCQVSAPQQIKIIEKTIIKEVPIKVPIHPIITTTIPNYRPKSCCISTPKLRNTNVSPPCHGKINFNYLNSSFVKNDNNTQTISKNLTSFDRKVLQPNNISILPQTHENIPKSSRLSQSRKKILKQKSSHKKGIEIVQKKKVTIQSRILNSEQSRSRRSLFKIQS